MRSHHLVESPVFDALREILPEILGSHPRRSRARSVRNERDLERARTVPQPRRSRVSVVEPRRAERHVRMHVPEPIAPRRHLPDERVRDVAPQLALQVQVEAAPARVDVVAIELEVARVRDGERHQMQHRRLVLPPLPPRAHLTEARLERVGQSPRQPAAAARAAVAAEPPRPAPVQRRGPLVRASAADELAAAAAPLDLPLQRPLQRLGALGGVSGAVAGAGDTGQAHSPIAPAVYLRL